jgi:hypothetical protein
MLILLVLRKKKKKTRRSVIVWPWYTYVDIVAETVIIMTADSIDLLLLIVSRLASVSIILLMRIRTMMAMTFSEFNDIAKIYRVNNDSQVRQNDWINVHVFITVMSDIASYYKPIYIYTDENHIIDSSWPFFHVCRIILMMMITHYYSFLFSLIFLLLSNETNSYIVMIIVFDHDVNFDLKSTEMFRGSKEAVLSLGRFLEI